VEQLVVLREGRRGVSSDRRPGRAEGEINFNGAPEEKSKPAPLKPKGAAPKFVRAL